MTCSKSAPEHLCRNIQHRTNQIVLEHWNHSELASKLLMRQPRQKAVLAFYLTSRLYVIIHGKKACSRHLRLNSWTKRTWIRTSTSWNVSIFLQTIQYFWHYIGKGVLFKTFDVKAQLQFLPSNVLKSTPRSNNQKVLFRIAVLHYFESFDKKLHVEVYIFRKAAPAALQKMHTFMSEF